jgi:hypothetical protein
MFAACPIRMLFAALLAVSSVVAPSSAFAEKVATTHANISYHEWTTRADFAAGTSSGAISARGAIRFATATGSVSYDDQDLGFPTRTYNSATWTSPMYAPGFGATELVASWNADTPAGTWVQVQMRGTTSAANMTKWYVMGRWASVDADIHRTSLGGQGDADGTISIDTFVSRKGVALTSYQLRVTLLRLPTATAGPTVRSIGAMPPACPTTARCRSVPRAWPAVRSWPSQGTRRTCTSAITRSSTEAARPGAARRLGAATAARQPERRLRHALYLRRQLPGHRRTDRSMPPTPRRMASTPSSPGCGPWPRPRGSSRQASR